jgi:catechol 2,3-dioxygenase-like lactoylglutathione lyase family enzyme
MIERLSHVTIYVLDQDAALKFYTEKLGFIVRTDATMGDFRWLTLGIPTQPDLEIVLMPVKPSPMMDEETVRDLKRFIEKGLFGAGAFDTSDCRKTYEELKKRGVEFLTSPEERPYGSEATFKDNSGNWFSLTEHPESERIPSSQREGRVSQ